MTYSPGLQIPDGRVYPDGLVRAWRAHSPTGANFPLAFKVRQTFDTGWRVALTEAMAYGVQRLHIALIPAWLGGSPDWAWVRATLRELNDLIPDDMAAFVRLGNYRDGKTEGCDFVTHAQHEWRFGQILSKSPRLFWSVGDDRGIVASVKGWRERKAAYHGWMPDSLEWQDYGLTGLIPSHIGLAQDALYEAGFVGGLALVEHHRWFPGGDQTMGDLPELFTAETGEYLLSVWSACRDRGIGYHLFTGDMAFDQDGDLNPVGLALFNRTRPIVTAWTPPRLKSWWQGVRLGG